MLRKFIIGAAVLVAFYGSMASHVEDAGKSAMQNGTARTAAAIEAAGG